jgi:hypothetical protein
MFMTSLAATASLNISDGIDGVSYGFAAAMAKPDF